MSTYVTKQGDMWDAIAFEQCGSTSCTDKLMRLNMRYCSLFVFPAGIELSLPEVTAADQKSELPPWKQVSE